MICATCGREVKRVCRDCQADRARSGILEHQRRFLETWLQGTMDLRLRLFGGVWHLELFDARWHAYCGARLFQSGSADYSYPPGERRRTKELPPDLCSGCTQIFNELVTKARTEGR